MFVEHKETGEVTEAPAKTLRLSQAIRKGLPIVEEDRGKWTMCALGAAFAGVHGRQINGEEIVKFSCEYLETYHGIADAIGFPRHLCQMVHERHYNDCWSATSIADWLESKGH